MRRQWFGPVKQSHLLRKRRKIIETSANQNVNGLGGVHNTAASYDHHAVSAALPVKSRPLVDQIEAGVLHDLVVDTDQFQAGGFYRFDHHVRHTSLNEPLVRVEDHLPAS